MKGAPVWYSAHKEEKTLTPRETFDINALNFAEHQL